MHENRNAALKRTREQAGFDADLRGSCSPRTDQGAPPAKPTVCTRPDRLHALPPELLDLIADRLIPHPPYLSRPYGSEISHFPIAPALRALSSWGATCKQAQALVAAVCKEARYYEFRQLASAADFELHPQARAALIERYGLDPTGSPPPQNAMVIELHAESGLASRSSSLEQSAGKLEKLELHLYQNAYADVSRLVVAVGLCTGLKYLSLHSNMPFPISLLDTLQSLPALRTLELRGKGLPKDLFARLARLPAAPQLECLTISAPDLGLEQLQALVSAAPGLRELRFLNLHARVLGKPECEAIASACGLLPRLESLQIGAAPRKVNVQGALAVAQSLSLAKRVHRLGLHNLADDKMARADLFRTLRQYTELLELRLTGRLEIACVQEIGQMLSDSSMRLQVLDLDCCGLGQDGFRILSEGVKASNYFRELRLSKVEFNDEVAQILGAAIQANTSLLALTLDYCTIEPGLQLEALCAAVSSSTSLREFHVKIAQGRNGRNSGNNSGLILAAGFAAAAAKSSSLLHMSMGPQRSNGLLEAQNKLACNRRRLELGLEA